MLLEHDDAQRPKPKAGPKASWCPADHVAREMSDPGPSLNTAPPYHLCVPTFVASWIHVARDGTKSKTVPQRDHEHTAAAAAGRERPGAAARSDS